MSAASKDQSGQQMSFDSINMRKAANEQPATATYETLGKTTGEKQAEYQSLPPVAQTNVQKDIYEYVQED